MLRSHRRRFHTHAVSPRAGESWPALPAGVARTSRRGREASTSVARTCLSRFFLGRYCYVTEALLRRYCYATEALLRRYCYATEALLLCHGGVTKALLLCH
eukprot:8985940-Pyramimonas_sp.AAC.2